MEKRINLFITEQGARLKVNGQRLFVQNEKETFTDIPLIHLRQIVIFGNATITPSAVSRLLTEGIFVSFLTMNGRFIGILLPPEHSDGMIIKMQVKRSEDELFRLTLAKEIVSAKIHNSLALLLKKRRKKVDTEKEIAELKRVEDTIQEATSIKELLGLEGTASRVYFSVMNRIFDSEFQFDGRKKHPATDPLNAMLSFSYTLLYSICFSFLHVVGLDPYIGFYHEMRKGHASLASDLSEEFRSYICDSLVLRLVNQKYFDKDAFTYTGESVFFTKEAMKLFLKEWATNLDRIVNVDGSFNTSLWHLIELQAQNLRKSVLTGEKYSAFRSGE
ncbi:CRISPR-associated endonuclease Cas1 [Calditerrivibrio nitroreducens]|uniref:CRISPR-associated endonuclease Cas1 n=1 Tax=Calditerrivibrio nitroreducens TaxID=477976 RepID=UPI003C7773A4